MEAVLSQEDNHFRGIVFAAAGQVDPQLGSNALVPLQLVHQCQVAFIASNHAVEADLDIAVCLVKGVA